MSIKSELEKLVRNTSDGDVGYAVNVAGKIEIPKAHQAILAEFERMIPKERVVRKVKNHWSTTMNGKIGESNCEADEAYNQAIQEIKAKLEKE